MFIRSPFLLFMIVFWGGGFLTFCVSHVSAGTALDTILGECEKRTGFGESTCLTLIRKNLTLDRCKSYTSFSDEDCQKKIEEIKKDPKFLGVPPTNTFVTPELKVENKEEKPLSVSPQPNRHLSPGEVRAKKEKQLQMLWQETQILLRNLKARGVDTSVVESHLSEIENRSRDILSAYDAYQSVFDGTKNDPLAIQVQLRSAAREKVHVALTALTDSYRVNIFGPLQGAFAQI